MSTSRHWSARLGVEQGEWKGVQLLFLHNFLQGLGIAFFATGAVSMFLHSFGAMGLALSLAAGGVAMLVASRVYAHFEHKMPLERFLPGAVLFLAVAALLSWSGLFLGHGAWLLFALFTLYRVHYLVSSLEFWGLTALLYNVRQGKRLFGLIGSADIPAKIMGFLSVYLLVPVLGEQHLLLLSALFFGGSWWVVRLLVRRHAHGLHHGHGHSHHARPERFLIRFFGNRFILRLSLFALLVGIGLVLIEYALYGEVKLRFKKSKDLSMFLSAFLSAVMAVTFVVKLLFSGKVLLRVGMRRSLLIFVGTLLACAVALLFVPFDQKGTVYLGLFMGLYGVRDTLRFSIYDPAFLSLFQPLSPQLRLKGHTVIKGVVDAVAMSTAGILLCLMLYANGTTTLLVDHHDAHAALPHAPADAHTSHDAHTAQDAAHAADAHAHHTPAGASTAPADKGPVLGQLLFILVVVLALAQPALWMAYAEWRRMLQAALRKRFLDGGALLLGDSQALEMTGQLLRSEKPAEVIYGLQLLHKAAPQQMAAAISQCLRHSSPEVVEHALGLISSGKVDFSQIALAQVLKSPIPHLRAKALTALVSLSSDWKPFAGSPEDRDPQFRLALLEGLMARPDAEARAFAEAQMHHTLQFSSPEDAAALREMLAFAGKWRLSLPDSTREHLERHPDAAVRQAVLLTQLRTGDQAQLSRLLQQAQRGPARREARLLLTLAGEQVALPPASLDEPSLVLVCRLLSSQPAAAVSPYLLSLCSHVSAVVRSAAIEALAAVGHTAQGADRRTLSLLLEQSHHRMTLLMRWMHTFHTAEKLSAVHDALRIELAEEVTEALHLLSCISDPAEVRRARQGLRSHAAELRADGIEAIDHLLANPSLRKAFTPALEHLYLQRSLPVSATAQPAAVLREVLRSWDGHFHAWTLTAVVEGLALHHPLPPLAEADLPALPLPALAMDALAAVQRHHPNAFTDLFASTSLLPHMSQHSTVPAESESTLSLVEKVMTLRRVSLFEGTPDHVLAEVAAVCREQRADNGETLIRTGEQGNCMYMVVEGAVRIEREGRKLATFGAGEFFGELSLLEAELRTADAIATEESLLLVLDQDDFYELIEDRHEVMQAIMVTLARRIRKQNEVIAQLGK